MKNYIILLFIIISNLFANEGTLINLQKEKEALIYNYILRIEAANDENLEDRAALLDETLNCFISSKTRRDISNCKSDERRRIMAIISEN